MNGERVGGGGGRRDVGDGIEGEEGGGGGRERGEEERGSVIVIFFFFGSGEMLMSDASLPFLFLSAFCESFFFVSLFFSFFSILYF